MVEPHTIDWELQLGFLIHDTSRLRRAAFDRYLKPLNITRSQWWVLAYLSRKDGMTQSDLAQELDLGKVAVGGLIDRLQKNNLVRRVADPNDRRVNLIYLEPESRRLLSSLRKANHKFNARILAGLSDKQLVAAAETLEVMKRNLLGYLESPDDDDLEPLKPSAASQRREGVRQEEVSG